MLARIPRALVAHLADVNGVAEQRIERAAREGLFTGAGPITSYAEFGTETISVKVLLEQAHAAKLAVSLEDMSDRGGFGFDHCQLPLVHLVAERDQTTHPHAFALRGRNFVADALAGYLAFELREREQYVERQATHRSRGVELLRYRDKGNLVSVEDLNHLGEVRKRSRQPIDLIDDHDVDQALFDVRQQQLERRTLHRRTGKTAVVIMCLAQSPALPLLTPDVRFTSLALGVQRIEVLLQAFFRGLTGVDRATQRLLLTRLHYPAPCWKTSNQRRADLTSDCP